MTEPTEQQCEEITQCKPFFVCPCICYGPCADANPLRAFKHPNKSNWLKCGKDCKSAMIWEIHETSGGHFFWQINSHLTSHLMNSHLWQQTHLVAVSQPQWVLPKHFSLPPTLNAVVLAAEGLLICPHSEKWVSKESTRSWFMSPLLPPFFSSPFIRWGLWELAWIAERLQMWDTIHASTSHSQVNSGLLSSLVMQIICYRHFLSRDEQAPSFTLLLQKNVQVLVRYRKGKQTFNGEIWMHRSVLLGKIWTLQMCLKYWYLKYNRICLF